MWDMMEVYDKSEARGWPTIGDAPPKHGDSNHGYS